MITGGYVYLQHRYYIIFGYRLKTGLIESQIEDLIKVSSKKKIGSGHKGTSISSWRESGSTGISAPESAQRFPDTSFEMVIVSNCSLLLL